MNAFQFIKRTRLRQELVTDKVQWEITQIVSMKVLWFLHSARRLMLIDICIKIKEHWVNPFLCYRVDMIL